MTARCALVSIGSGRRQRASGGGLCFERECASPMRPLVVRYDRYHRPIVSSSRLWLNCSRPKRVNMPVLIAHGEYERVATYADAVPVAASLLTNRTFQTCGSPLLMITTETPRPTRIY
jgi:hypothetical protein